MENFSFYFKPPESTFPTKFFSIYILMYKDTYTEKVFPVKL